MCVNKANRTRFSLLQKAQQKLLYSECGKVVRLESLSADEVLP